MDLIARAAVSERVRKSLEVKSEKGSYHYGLVWHPSGTKLFNVVLEFEAQLNNTTLEEWLIKHRYGGSPRGDEIYVPPDVWIANLGDNKFYCFLGFGEYAAWKAASTSMADRPRLIDNIDRIKELCREYTRKRKLELSKKGHPLVTAKLRMTHQVKCYFNSCDRAEDQSYPSSSIPCRPIGTRMVFEGVPHMEIELEDGKRVWVIETEISSAGNS